MVSGKGHVFSMLENALKAVEIYRGKQKSQRSLWFCHSTPAPFLLHSNTPLGRGRKGLHLSNWNASGYCVPFDFNALFEDLLQQTHLTFAAEIKHGDLI